LAKIAISSKPPLTKVGAVFAGKGNKKSFLTSRHFEMDHKREAEKTVLDWEGVGGRAEGRIMN